MERPNQNLKSLLAFWNEKRGARQMPARADLPASALKPWLGNLALIDVKNAKNASFRLCGINLRGRFDGEVTGREIESLGDGIAASLRAAVWRAQTSCKPVETTHKIETQSEPVIFHELCLPLADDGVTMDTVLFASYAEKKHQ